MSGIRSRTAIGVAATAAIAIFLTATVPSIRAFAAEPTTPYADVSRRTAGQFDAYATAIVAEHPSLLVADVGATLFESHLRVYDLAGLCEPDVVHTLKGDTQYWRFEHPEFFDWVFDRIKPTFISTDKFWTYVPAFEKDPRFRRDYVAINTYVDTYVQRTYRVTMHGGDFVRRDALGSLADIERLRQAYQPAPWPDTTVAADAPLETVSATARGLDTKGRAHDARGLWTRVAAAASVPSALFLDALDRLGDSRPLARGGDALDPDMNAGMRLLYTQNQPAAALEIFDAVLAANRAHYGAHYQRARALTLLDRAADARAEWNTVLLLSSRISDQNTIATALAELKR